MRNYHLHTPEGVKDLLWESAQLKHTTVEKILDLFAKHSYHRIETPTFEYLDVFTLEEGRIQNPHLYQFMNRQGELVALRNDITCAIARVVATQNSSIPFPQRYCYLANSFRYPERYQGKRHEFTQAGVELIGDDTVEGDAEIIKLAIQSMEGIGVKGLVVHLGNASFFPNLFEDMALKQEVQEEIFRAIENKDGVKIKATLEANQVSTEWIEMISQLIQRTGDLSLLKKIRDTVGGALTKASLDYLEALYLVLEDYGLAKCIQFDFSVLSYASYYTGMMFQGFLPEIGSAVMEGGRYNRLLARYGKNLPAVGFGINSDLVLQKLQKQQAPQAINSRSTLIVYHPHTRALALELADHFRNQGMIVENYLNSNIDSAIAYAKAIGMGGILYFESKEAVAIYDMTGKDAQYVDPMALF